MNQDSASETTAAGPSGQASAAPFHPPAIDPPPAPRPLWRVLPSFVANPLRTLPAAAYREPIVVVRPNPRRDFAIAWITGPSLVEQVLVRDAELFAKSPIEKRVLGHAVGESVLTADGAKWRWQRRTIAPLFRHQDILSYVPQMRAAAEARLQLWARDGAPQTRDMERELSAVTFDVILATMLVGGKPAEASAILDAGMRYLAPITWEVAWSVLHLPSWLPHPATWRIQGAARVMRCSVDAIVARRQASPVSDDGTRPDLLARLIAAKDPETGQGMSPSQLTDNLLTLLMAGHETTAKALTWALYLLARAPEWQEAVRGEVHAVAGAGAIEAQHLERLQLTERVLKETLRLFPSAPVLARQPVTDVEVGGHRLPRASQVLVPIWCIHRHEALWEDPGRFDPDRFLPERAERLWRTQFMPFGAGPRTCLGMAFAMVEAKALLATLVRAARFSCRPELAPEPISRVTLKPRGGMPLRVEVIDAAYRA